MMQPYFRTLVGAVALTMLVPLGADGQTTPWGDPDLQGTYTNKTITPLERPDTLGDKEFLTAEEVASEEQSRLDQNLELLLAPPQRTEAGGNVGGYNNFWLDGGTRPTGRTSLISDPPNGRMPARTGSAASRKTAHDASFPVDGPFDSWEDLELNDRCLVWSAGPPMLPSAYNNNVQIFQTPDHVVILSEMIHEVRVVPLDGRPPLPEGMRQWMGDARGWWDGDTLVVESDNYTDKTGSFYTIVSTYGSGESLHLVERFTRVSDDTLRYEFTVDDPSTFSAPFTAAIPMQRTDAPLFEYACHEGNYGMTNLLAGARVQER